MAGIQIMIVEDEVIVAEDIKRSLQNLGYKIPSVVPSGEAAIKKVTEIKPDLVLMDIMLQGNIDGIEAASSIRSNFDIPVVYLTAYSDEKILERAKITEPFGYIIKPFKERELQINIEIDLYKHKIEKKLKESREWYKITLKSISDAVIATDPEARVLFMNPVAQLMTGWNMEEAKGMPLKDVFNIVSEKNDDNVNKTVLISKNKVKTPLDSSTDTIKDGRGNIVGIVLVFRKITGTKTAV
ncbi:Chemotaxis protein CheY [uncultured archaeon]|nr:Chemotaxis protein CheY [uncultured archaeon]